MTKVGEDALAGFGMVHNEGVIGIDDLELLHSGHFSTFNGHDAVVFASEE